jgi:hypothetical protein
MRKSLASIVPPPVAFAALALVFAGINLLAVQIDPASTSNGMPVVSLETLNRGNHLAIIAFLLNCGFVLGYGAFAYFSGAKRRRTRSMSYYGRW